MRNVGRKHEIRKTRDFIRIRLISRRKCFYKYKATPNEAKGKNVINIFKKASVRASESSLNTPLNTREALRKYFRNEWKKR